MIGAAADFSDEPQTVEKCIQLLTRLINMCDIGLELLSPDSSIYVVLCELRWNCEFELLIDLPFRISLSRIVLERVLDLRKKVEKAYSDAVSNFVVFTCSKKNFVVVSISSAEGGVYVNIGPHSILAPDNLRVNHPLRQMLLFAKEFHVDSFACLKSMAPKSIARMTETSGSSASPTEYIAGWTSANWKSESPNAARNPLCGSKKPQLPVLFDISAMKKTSSTVSVILIPQSGDNVKHGPYDSPMTVAEGNCGLSNKSNLELGKAGNRLPFREESNNCQQHDALTGGNHDATLQMRMAQEVGYVYSVSLEKMPTAAGSVKSALRITPFAFTPMVTDLTEIDLRHLRGLNSAAKNNNQQGASILMIDGDRRTDDITIMDSGGSVHASGNLSHFTQLVEEPQGVIVFGANRQQMLDFGFGTIRIPNLGLELQGVYYIPEMGNKTIVSVSKLNELGYSVNFSPTGCTVRDERTWTHRLIGEARRVNGLFELEYLRTPLNRAPTVSDGTLTSTSLWRAAWTRLNSFTKSLVQRYITPSSERLPQ